MRDLVQMVRGLLVRAVVKLVGGQKLPIVRVAGIDEVEAEHFQPYGLACKPLAGAEAIVGMVGGTSHPVVLVVADRRYRPSALADGDVVLHDNRDQKLGLYGAGAVLDAQSWRVNCDSTFDGDVTVVGDVTAANVTAAGTVSGGTLAAGAGGLSVGGTSIPLPGASGTFTTQDGKTVTVVEGIITSIV